MVISLNLSPSIPALPRSETKQAIDVRYLLIPPYASTHIHWDATTNEVVYDLEEPLLQDKEKDALTRIENALFELINVATTVENTPESTILYLDKTARLLMSELNITVSEDSYQRLFYYLYRDFVGMNEIEALLKDYFIEDIECNGIGSPLYVIHRIYRNLRTNIVFTDVEKLASFVEKLAQRTGRYVSYAQPLLDGSLPDGSRVNASYTKDVTSKGPTFTIRKFTKVPWTPTQLLSFGTISPEMLAYFWLLIEHKSSILIAGGTGSGKTTLLNALAFFIPPEARVVSIEDTREINLPRENWLPSVARPSVGSSKVGEIDLFALLKSSFRQAPDYLIVGEVRGKEAFVLFQGMASGHASLSTMHADSVDTLIKRLETPPIELSPTLVTTLDCVAVMTHAVTNQKETRKLKEIVEIVNVLNDGTATVNTPFMWDPAQDKFFFRKQSKVLEKISSRTGIPLATLQQELTLRSKLLYLLYQRGVFGFEEIGNIINLYHKNPQEILAQYPVDVS